MNRHLKLVVNNSKPNDNHNYFFEKGELKIILFNHSDKNFIINNNDRVAQMILTPIIKMELEETIELPDSIRGEGGFGSTGK